MANNDPISSVARGNTNYININVKDRNAIYLLQILLIANGLNFVSNIFSYFAITNGIKFIYKSYYNSKEEVYNPDILAIYSIFTSLIASTITTNVGFTKYENAYKAYLSGDSRINMNNFANINYANTTSILSGLIALSVAEDVYERDGLNIFV